MSTFVQLNLLFLAMAGGLVLMTLFVAYVDKRQRQAAQSRTSLKYAMEAAMLSQGAASTVVTWPKAPTAGTSSDFEMVGLTFSYDAKAGRFSHVTYRLRPKGPLVGFFENRIEPLLLSQCPPDTRRQEAGCEVRTHGVYRKYRYALLPWWKRLTLTRVLLAPKIEANLDEDLSDPAQSVVEIEHWDPDVQRVAQLYRALSGLEGASRDPVESIAARLEAILANSRANPDQVVNAVRQTGSSRNI